MLELPVQVTFYEEDLCNHTCIRRKEKIWMPLEQILQVDWSKTLPVLFDQVKLFLHEFVFVLEG